MLVIFCLTVRFRSTLKLYSKYNSNLSLESKARKLAITYSDLETRIITDYREEKSDPYRISIIVCSKWVKHLGPITSTIAKGK